MMQAGIFTGYFPYGLKETAQKIREQKFNTVQLDLHFKDVDLSAGQITKEKAKKVRNAFRDKNLPICCISGYTNIYPSRQDGEREARRISERNPPQCSRVRFALRDLRDRNLQHRVGLGLSSEEQDAGRLRGVPEGHSRSRA